MRHNQNVMKHMKEQQNNAFKDTNDDAGVT